ncbi:MAG: hypothetical protein GXP08_15570 [Gammaproteobacteria bacterium]|nr:hypothetical protein [Gammaproteobacteria bacterium]
MNDKNVVQADGVSKVVRAGLLKILSGLMNSCDSITGLMVSGADGMALAAKLTTGFDQHRFSAMSSALLAISDSLMMETNNGKTKNVYIESEGGNVFVMHAGSSLLLTVFTDASTSLGLSLAHANNAAEEIAALNIGGYP